MARCSFLLFLLAASLYGQEDSLIFPVPDPVNFEETINFDEEEGTYEREENAGDLSIARDGEVMTYEEYLEWKRQKAMRENWSLFSGSQSLDSENRSNALAKKLEGILPEYSLDKEKIGQIFGADKFELRLNGSVELDFQFKSTFRDDNSLLEQNRRQSVFKLDNDIQINADGQIGDKLNLTTDFFTQRLFGENNQINLTYEGEEDEIIKIIQVGNISLPLPGTLITGSQQLFGFKTKLQFGPTSVTTVYSEQRTQSNSYQVSNGGSERQFEFYATEYDMNRHYFLDHYFYENYDAALAQLPYIRSQVEINKVEVWVTNSRTSSDNLRDIVAITDLGNDTNAALLPANENNALDPENLVIQQPGIRDYNTINPAMEGLSLDNIRDFEKIEKARKLLPNEYYVHPQLGFISLNQQLRDGEVLAVAYQYTINGQVKQVGEFSEQLLSPNVLIMKMLKPTIIDLEHPSWTLMMKNVYNLGASQIDAEDFELNILYKKPESGTKLRYIPAEGLDKMQIINVLNLDNLNANNDEGQDGFFDFVEGVTINARRGRIYLPAAEPFGDFLLDRIQALSNLSEAEARAFTFPELYSKTQNDAEQRPRNNRFLLSGSFKSQFGAEIILENAYNLARGSVVVEQGSERLVEDRDFVVDYNIGKVTIINESKLNSATPLNVRVESQTPIGIAKRFLGLRLEHSIDKNFNLGASIVSLKERPFTNKVNFGDEPLNNTIWGLDASYQKPAPFLTTLADKLPFYSTDATSNINMNAEFAQFLPGQSSIIAIDEGGTSYIDDFENGEVRLSILFPRRWTFASVPLGIDNTPQGIFPEATLSNDIVSGFNRAQLAWYQIAVDFYNRTAPENIKDNPAVLEDPYQRDIRLTEIFENRDIPPTEINRLFPLNIHFDPTQPGPYNFDVEGGPFSAGLNPDGTLKNPRDRWGGIMQAVNNADWEQLNIEYVEFWMMDPYLTNPDHQGGDMYLNLGSMNEDVLQDGRKAFENGLPTPDNPSTVDTTAWGFVSNSQILVRTFDANNGALQDRGYDGMGDVEEQLFSPPSGSIQSSYLDRMKVFFGTTVPAIEIAQNDPARDNYIHFFSDQYDSEGASITERYKQSNGVQNNTFNDFIGSSTRIPDLEDIDGNNTLNESQSYYQYRIPLRPEELNLDNPYIIQEKNNTGPNNDTKWYLFRIPVRDFQTKFGSISDFKSIRYMRFFMHDFEEPVTVRMATLNIVRGNWRQYDNVLTDDEIEDADASFEIGSINIEANGNKEPIPYVLPPGIDRERNQAAAVSTIQNEQSLYYRVCDLSPGASKASFKNLGLNLNNYKSLRMFVHAEALETETLNDGDLSAYIRVGTDFSENYYEYEIPLTVTPWFSTDPNRIWPAENEMDIDFEQLINLKLQRNKDIIATQGSATPILISDIYEGQDNGKAIYVKGNPNLADVSTIMIGVRNRSTTGDVCAEVWLNELRLVDIKNESAIAFRGQVQANIADLADVNLSGSYKEAGFGSLDQNLIQRNFETFQDISANTTVNAGKLFPQKWGVNLPVYYGISEVKNTPQYNPLDPDVLYRDAINNAEGAEEKQRIEESAVTKSTYRSFNVNNVGISPQGKKNNRFYDLSNVRVGYAQTELVESSPQIEKNIERRIQGQVGYNYGFGGKPIEPFKSIKFLQRKKGLKFLKELNFKLWPTNINYTYSFDRLYKENKVRSIRVVGEDFSSEFDPFFSQSLRLDQNFGLAWDPTKSIRLSLNGSTNSVFEGDSANIATPRDVWVSEVLKVYDGGTLRNYNQTFDASYRLPLQYFPLLNIFKMTAKYNAVYDYIGSTTANREFGSIIKNTRNVQFNGGLDLRKAYKDIPGLRSVYNPRGTVNILKKRQAKKKDRLERKKSKKEKRILRKASRAKEDLKSIQERIIEQGQSQDSTLTNKDIDSALVSDNIWSKEEKLEETLDVLDSTQEENKTLYTDKISDVNERYKAKIKDARKNKGPGQAISAVVRLATMLKTVDGTYRRNEGLLVPGFSPQADAFGTRQFTSPTLGFIFGQQEYNGSADLSDVIGYIGDRDWIVNSVNLNNPVAKSWQETLDLKALVEPFKNFRINFEASRSSTLTQSALFKNVNLSDPSNPMFRELNRVENGQYTVSILPINTAFTSSDQLFDQFLSNGEIVATRIAELYSNEFAPAQTLLFVDGFPVGFQQDAQEVLIPTFVSTYMGTDPNTVTRNKFPQIPMPNWNVRYSGFRDIAWLKNKIQRASFSSAYRAEYSINNYSRNLFYDQILDQDKFSYTGSDNRDISGNFHPEFLVSQVVITEQFSPFLKLDVRLQNDWNFNISYDRARNLALNTNASQILEENKRGYTIGAGYKLNDVKIFKKGLGRSKVPRTMEFRFNLSYNFNRSQIRNAFDGDTQVSRGSESLGVNLNIDYQINEFLTSSFYYDRNTSQSFVQAAFATTQSLVGIKIRYTLSER